MPLQGVVIGASAGGLEPLREVVSLLPPHFPSPVFIVLHIPPHSPSPLADILSRAGSLPATHPADDTTIQPGRIYVAPPDHHLLINAGAVSVKRGPKENGFRPSVDALFRSAAYTYGPGAVGVVLSGALNDGTSGLWSIKRLGGRAVVQEPSDAAYPSMPRSALEYIEADFTGSPAEIGAFLAQLPEQQPAPAASAPAGIEDDARRLALETQIAAGLELPEETVIGLGQRTAFTCPECHGALVAIAEGNRIRFRCHTGHAFSADALLEGLTDTLQEYLWQTTRGYQEGSMLLEHIARHLREGGQLGTAQVFLEKSRQMNRQASDLQKMALAQQSLSEENVGIQRAARNAQVSAPRK
jgi:two-component system chemotaxis response regulator CheB